MNNNMCSLISFIVILNFCCITVCNSHADAPALEPLRLAVQDILKAYGEPHSIVVLGGDAKYHADLKQVLQELDREFTQDGTHIGEKDGFYWDRNSKKSAVNLMIYELKKTSSTWKIGVYAQVAGTAGEGRNYIVKQAGGKWKIIRKDTGGVS